MTAPTEPRRVLSAVSEAFCVPLEDIRGPRRLPSVVRARQAAAVLLRAESRLTLVEVGALLCRHHSTVCHAVEAMLGKMADRPALADRVAGIRRDLHPGQRVPRIHTALNFDAGRERRQPRWSLDSVAS